LKIVNFQVALKQNYATEITCNETCLHEKCGFAISPSAFAVSTPRQVRGGVGGGDTPVVF